MVTVSKWYLDSEVERCLIQRGYKIISIRELFNTHYDVHTNKEMMEKFSVPVSFLYKKFAYTSEHELYTIIQCLTDALDWIKSEGTRLAIRNRYSWSLHYRKDPRGGWVSWGWRTKLITANDFLISTVFKKEVEEVLKNNSL